MTSQPSEWRDQRKLKLSELASLGLPFHPRTYEPSHSAAQLQSRFDELEGQEVTVAGRLVADNRMGKAAFLRLQDSSGRIQLYVKRDVVGEDQWQYYRLLDRGDILGATGPLFKTKTGEVTVQVQNLILLQKAYQPLPEKFHGLQDVETRYRQRYLDLIANDESRETALKRSRMMSSIRRYLDERGFLEVETPILQPIYGGGAATPFTTRVEAFDMRMYLRIAVELYLKRLIVGGLERVYEIGKDFRNEGFSRKHSQEFTMLELYQAYADYEDMMQLLEELCRSCATALTGGTMVEFDGHQIDFGPPWTRISFSEAVAVHAKLRLDERGDRESLFAHARDHGVVVSKDMSRGALLDQIWSAMVEPHLIQPTIVRDYPVDFPGSAFARASAHDPDVVERFEAFMGGIEIANAFTELNDPFEQEERLELIAQTPGLKYDPEERDLDFITALEYGMPPTGGLGVGLDRLAMVLTNADHIRETILFPLLRRRDDDPC